VTHATVERMPDDEVEKVCSLPRPTSDRPEGIALRPVETFPVIAWRSSSRGDAGTLDRERHG